MSREYQVVPEELTREGFLPYGQAILPPQLPAPKQGKDWDCWVPLGALGEGAPSVGIVLTRSTPGIIRAMEREPKTEFLLPITGPVVQAVALPGDLSDPGERPAAATVRAFIVHPGQAIIMSPGTWHWAALPLNQEEVLYYFATELRPPTSAGPWISFQNGDTTRLRIAA